jgi:hypothetical protein
MMQTLKKTTELLSRDGWKMKRILNWMENGKKKGIGLNENGNWVWMENELIG